MQTSKVCPHGSLRRKCDLCDANDEIDRLEHLVAHQNGNLVMAGLKVAELEDEITRLREYCRPCDIEAAERGK